MSDPSPQALISLTCSNTEIVCALGCADRLIAVDDHSDFPPAVVSALPRVGPDLTIDIAKVASMAPDLVLASLTVPGHEHVVAGLEAAGLPHIAPRPQSIEDVFRNILHIAELLGVPQRGEEVVSQLRVDLEPAPPRRRRPRIAVQWWPKPVIIPGQLSWVQSLIERAGGENVLAEAVESRPLTDEEFAELAPDGVVLSWCGVEVEKYRPDVVYRKELWSEVPAVRRGRVVSITEAWLGRPSPRLADGYKALRGLLDDLEQDLIDAEAAS